MSFAVLAGCEAREPVKAVSRADAVEIADQAFQAHLDEVYRGSQSKIKQYTGSVDGYAATVAIDGEAFRVTYRLTPPRGMDDIRGGGAEYLIDRQSGVVLSSEYFH